MTIHRDLWIWFSLGVGGVWYPIHAHHITDAGLDRIQRSLAAFGFAVSVRPGEDYRTEYVGRHRK